jgi:hypothetical protein
VIDVETSKGRQFRASLDTFGAGSGAGVFDPSGRLLGIAVNGARDHDSSPEGCQKTRVLDESNGVESVTYAARAVEELCSVAPRAELCAEARGVSSCSVGPRHDDGSIAERGAWAVLVFASLARRRGRSA